MYRQIYIFCFLLNSLHILGYVNKNSSKFTLKAINFIPVQLRKGDSNKSSYGTIHSKFLEDKWAPIYQTTEHQNKLIIKPYSIFLFQLKGTSYKSFLKKHDFYLFDSKKQKIPLNVYYKNGDLEVTSNNYTEIILKRYPHLKKEVEQKKWKYYKLKILGWEKVKEDGIIIEPMQYLGGNMENAINKVYRLEVRKKKGAKKVVYKKSCITLFSSKKKLTLFNVYIIPTDWEKKYGYYPHIYSFIDYGVRAYNRDYFVKPIGKTLLKEGEVAEFVLRYEGKWRGNLVFGGLGWAMNRVRKAIGLENFSRKEIYNLYRTPYFAKRFTPDGNWPIINADFGGIRSRMYWYSSSGDLGHEVGHNWGLPHGAGIMFYIYHGYSAEQYWTVLRRLTDIKALRGALHSKDSKEYYGNGSNVIIVKGGYQKPRNDIKKKETGYSYDKEKYKKNVSINIPIYKHNQKKSEISCLLYYFEPKISGKYEIFVKGYGPSGNLVVRTTHFNEKNKLTTKAYVTLIKKTSFNTKISSPLLGFKKGKSYPIFIYYLADKKFPNKGYIKFKEIKVKIKSYF